MALQGVDNASGRPPVENGSGEALNEGPADVLGFVYVFSAGRASDF
jgi:hypothetical protein